MGKICLSQYMYKKYDSYMVPNYFSTNKSIDFKYGLLDYKLGWVVATESVLSFYQRVNEYLKQDNNVLLKANTDFYPNDAEGNMTAEPVAKPIISALTCLNSKDMTTQEKFDLLRYLIPIGLVASDAEAEKLAKGTKHISIGDFQYQYNDDGSITCHYDYESWVRDGGFHKDINNPNNEELYLLILNEAFTTGPLHNTVQTTYHGWRKYNVGTNDDGIEFYTWNFQSFVKHAYSNYSPFFFVKDPSQNMKNIFQIGWSALSLGTSGSGKDVIVQSTDNITGLERLAIKVTVPREFM